MPVDPTTGDRTLPHDSASLIRELAEMYPAPEVRVSDLAREYDRLELAYTRGMHEVAVRLAAMYDRQNRHVED